MAEPDEAQEAGKPISEAEHAVMEALWARSPLTATEVARAMCDERGWSLPTVKTLLSRLVAKQARRHRARRAPLPLSPAARARRLCRRRIAPPGRSPVRRPRRAAARPPGRGRGADRRGHRRDRGAAEGAQAMIAWLTRHAALHRRADRAGAGAAPPGRAPFRGADGLCAVGAAAAALRDAADGAPGELCAARHARRSTVSDHLHRHDRAPISPARQSGRRSPPLRIVPRRSTSRPSGTAGAAYIVSAALVVWLAGAVAVPRAGGPGPISGCAEWLLDGARPVGEAGTVRLVETPAVSSPVAFGVSDKVVALPVGFMASENRAARDLAIEHELAHHRGRDLLGQYPRAADPRAALVQPARLDGLARDAARPGSRLRRAGDRLPRAARPGASTAT